jgi:5-methylthioadenosine/S-adenosylhomocysteine deaminase
VLDEAKNLGCAIHVHVSETAGEVEACIAEHGMSPVAYLESLGYFETHVAAAHCVHVSNEDIAILAQRGVNAVHNPTSNMKLASGIAPVQKMIDAGVNVALGTDGASSNNNLDMLEEMHIAALLAKLKDGEPTAVDARCAIEMATINGAKALGIDDRCGSLEAGKRADIIMLDMKSAFSYPRREYLNSLVYSMGRGQVAMTMIEGRVLQENGKVLGLDIESLGRTFNNCVDRLC